MIEALNAAMSGVQDSDLPAPADRARIRKASGLNQDAFGKILKVSRLSISMWEQGKTEPSGHNRQEYIKALRHIADVRGIPWTLTDH
ncbi:helix-turn-helix domain-containing protein [Streptomyces sp. NPDC001553]|uniref:helix-turn-helix domain-containing protein n=1 Tax=unclassified Streptomyces TaxID=2593676 RepID=UPI001447E4B4|nr:helix-turn-helix domain-containing protein [Streptomyces sp. A1136]